MIYPYKEKIRKLRVVLLSLTMLPLQAMFPLVRNQVFGLIQSYAAMCHQQSLETE